MQKDQQLVEKDQQLKQKDQVLLELSNKALVNKENTLMSRLEDHRRIFIMEINAKLGAFDKATKEEKQIVHKTINDLQSEVDKLLHYFKQQSQPQYIKVPHATKDITQPKVEAAIQNDKKHKKEDTNISKATDEEVKEMLNTNAEGYSLNPDIMPLMQKTGAYQNSAFSYTIPTENSSMATTTSHYGLQSENAPQLRPHKNLSNLVSIDLPNLSRRVTVKFGDIVEEEVDVIVNSANMHLLHNTGVAAAINKASGGIVQAESTKITCTGTIVPTGNAVATAAGGALKCKFVVHAVGPIADQHKNECALLLKNACISAMNVAANFKVYSIAFPPINSGNSGVPTDLVANIMIYTLCSYPCSNPTLLSDVRIVIADKSTFDTFLRIFHGYQQSIQQVYNNATTTATTIVATTNTTAASVIKPSSFQYSYSPGTSPVTDGTTKFPGHAQPVSYSQVVMQQPQTAREITYPINIFDAQPINLSSSSSQNHGDTIPGIPGDASFDSNKFPKSTPIASEPKHDPNDPGDTQDKISNPTHVQGNVSNNATNNDTNTDNKSISRHKFSIKSVNSGDIEDGKHSEDTLIDVFRENKDKTVSYKFAATNKSSGYDSSVDPVSTNPDLKPTTNNIKSSLQPTSTDPLNPSPSDKREEISAEKDGPKVFQDNTSSKPRQNSFYMIPYLKHLPPTQAEKQNGDKQNSSKKNDSNEKSEGKYIM